MLKSLRTLTACAAVGVLLGACDGSTKGKGDSDTPASELRLTSVDYGRLVDIYAYRRVSAANGQRRDVTNRVAVRVATDVIVDPSIETQPLFDPVGEEDPNSDFQFRPFDVATGHEELMILWDDTHPDEQARFASALQRAKSGLVPVAAAFTGQNTTVQPIPVVPRNAALKLTFTRRLSVDRSFFASNPAALQVLEIVDDPQTVQPQRAFRAVPYRVLVQGDALVLDPSLVGGEVTTGGTTSSGLPVSRDNTVANIRIAIPTQAVGGGLGVKADTIAQLNGNDRVGLPSVIRDFRTGNSRDGRVGTLVDVDKPMIVVDVPMGIMSIDTANRVLTLNKRGAKVAVRGQVPFAVGPLAITGFPLPMGPVEVPTVAPLRSGDFISQMVQTPAGAVRVRAEVIMNLDVSNTGPLSSNQNLGRAADGTDGGDAEIVRVRVASLSAVAPDGTPVAFVAATSPLGADCTTRVHYYENVPYSSGGHAVSDSARRAEFVTFDPPTPRLDPVTRQPIPLGTRIDPRASVSLRFSEPIDFARLDRDTNFVLTNKFLPDRTVASGTTVDIVGLLAEPKAAALSMLATTPEDLQQDGTVIRLNLPMGHLHDQAAAQPEEYWLHLIATDQGIRDFAGNTLDILDRRVGSDQRRAFSLKYSMDAEAATNLVGQRIMRFQSGDEDGTKPGSPDYFGQFELLEGRISGAPVTRFSKVADERTIAGIVRGPHGECFDPGEPGSVTPPVASRLASHITWGPLYTTPSMIQADLQQPPPNPFQPPPTPGYLYGGVGGPHNPRGGREQVTYREDDFGLGYHEADTMLIDVEQLFWSPWTNKPVLFDEFDRYTLRLGHASKRPDLRANWVVTPTTAYCGVDCASLFSGLSPNFDDNPLNGVMVEVVTDKAYTIDPVDSFRSSTENVYTPFPRFTKTFTWRDSRLVSWNLATQTATGLGGAVLPTQETLPPKDTTTDVSSPWETDVFPQGVVQGTTPPWPRDTIPTAVGYMVNDPGDFWGNRQRDMDPIALPLLCEFDLWPDDRANGSVIGANRMHIAFVGINNAHQTPYWGYYNLGVVPPPPASPVPHWSQQEIAPRPNCAGLQYPTFTVFSGGSVDRVGAETFIDPARERVARGSIVLDAASADTVTGLMPVPANNDHLYWTQANFVRRVSMCTFGFFDTLRPNRHDLVLEELGAPWEGLSDRNGLPDFQSVETRRVVDMVAVMDPPPESQPSGTSILLEVRGVESMQRNTTLWNRAAENRALERANLLNPEYACEAFRYAMANPGSGAIGGPRVSVEGLTPYVGLEQLDSIRSPVTRLLPRYMNYRLVFENDINPSAPKRPSLKSLALVYRVKVPD